MIRRCLYLLIACVLASVPVSADEVWADDYGLAIKQAKEQNRHVLLNFTGSDWCGWCIRLHNEVFSQKAFKEYARDNLICVVIDFPMRKQLSARIQQQNQALQQAYGVPGYPTIILLNPAGARIAVTGYRAGGAEAYVAHLKELIGPKEPVPAAPVEPATTEGTP